MTEESSGLINGGERYYDEHYLLLLLLKETMSNYINQSRENARIIKRVAIVSLLCNFILAAAKTTLGAVFSNVSVLSDATHTLSDVIITVLVLLSAFICSPKEDKKHNYGHEKIEPLMVLLFSVFLVAVGVLFAVEGVQGIMSPQKVTLNYYLLGITVLSIAAKEGMYWYTAYYAKKTRSDALKADAWHQRADGLSSVAVLIGLVCGIFIKTNIAESIAVLLVAALILKVAGEIFLSSVNGLIDRAAPDKLCGQISQIVLQISGVVRIDELRSRLFGSAVIVEIQVAVDGRLTVEQSQKIARQIQNALENQDEFKIKHCFVSAKSAL